ncbi:type IV secretory system conjugative DNA transfer family protein [Agrobacterium sp. ES01]|uniref:type IV secretory system conjugative DNA transfer family protein n=1 Tax=Agrobacterium sp. ES01 TaxID=3420714 RepID=UPI003D0FCAA2
MEMMSLFFRLVSFLLYGLLRAAWWVMVFLTAGAVNMLRSRSLTFGSARWARLHELLWGGVLGGNGIIVGKSWGRFLRFNQDGYALLFAPMRSGKGVGVVVPNLLTYKGSIICTDPKGENSAVTARRRRQLGHVVTLNAINPEWSDSFNPLDMVRIGGFHEADDALELAKLLVIPDSSNGGHWDNRATQLLQGLILYTCLQYAATPELRTLSKVRSLVTLGAEGLAPLMEDAKTLGSASLREFLVSFEKIAGSDEARSIFSNAEKAMAVWSGDRPAGLISQKSTFDFRDFNRKTMTCFLMVDEEKLPIYGGFLRMMMGCAIMAMTRAKSEEPPKIPTLLLLDEAAAMGRIEPLETGVGYLATYARMILVFQDLDQLKRTYEKSTSMIANAGCKIAFGVNDIETARMLADSIGQTTVTSHSAGQSQRSTDMFERQRNQGANEAGRFLIDPSEIMRLSRKKALIFFNGPVRHPVLARKIQYFKVWRWRGMWDQWRPRSAKIVPLLTPPKNVDRAA